MACGCPCGEVIKMVLWHILSTWQVLSAWHVLSPWHIFGTFCHHGMFCQHGTVSNLMHCLHFWLPVRWWQNVPEGSLTRCTFCHPFASNSISCLFPRCVCVCVCTYVCVCVCLWRERVCVCMCMCVCVCVCVHACAWVSACVCVCVDPMSHLWQKCMHRWQKWWQNVWQQTPTHTMLIPYGMHLSEYICAYWVAPECSAKIWLQQQQITSCQAWLVLVCDSVIVKIVIIIYNDAELVTVLYPYTFYRQTHKHVCTHAHTHTCTRTHT